MNAIDTHTRGPWEWIHRYPDYPEVDLRNGDDVVLKIYESHGGGLLPCEKDARLIAAAPELLEALCALRDAAMEVARTPWGSDLHAGIDAANAAIIKACKVAS